MSVADFGVLSLRDPVVLARSCAPPGTPASRHPFVSRASRDWDRRADPARVANARTVRRGYPLPYADTLVYGRSQEEKVSPAIAVLFCLRQSASRSGVGRWDPVGDAGQESAPFGAVATLTPATAAGGRPDGPAAAGDPGVATAAPGTRIALRVLVDQLESPENRGDHAGLAGQGQTSRTSSTPTRCRSRSFRFSGTNRPKPSCGRCRTSCPYAPRGCAMSPGPWVILGLILAAAGLYWWLKKRQRQREAAKANEAPHLWATREIERLEAQKVFEKGKVKEFYFASRKSCAAISRPSGGSRRRNTPWKRSRGTFTRSRTGSCSSCCGRRIWSSSRTPSRRPPGKTTS